MSLEEPLGAMRVVGFVFAEPAGLPAERRAAGDSQRGLACPVSPLGTLLQKNKQGSASSPDLLLVPSAPGSTASADDETVPFYGYPDAPASFVCCNPPAVYVNERIPDARALPDNCGSCAMDADDDMDCCYCQTFSEPIPIPEPRPKSPDPASNPKNLKRVPEPPMVRAVTAPAIVEELYAEYEKAKQQRLEQQMYQQMLATQELPAQKLAARRKSEAAAQAPVMEVERLSWRTVYTHMQTYGFTKRMTCT